MAGLQEMILISEILLQSKIAQRAAERLRATHDNFDQVETWCSIQSRLVAARNVSKILWPITKYKIRGEKLRQLLKVEKDNPPSNRNFRNHFDDYDKRIEDWFENHSSGVYVDLAMNPSLTNPFFQDTPKSNNSDYNSFNNTLIFRNETLDLNEVLIALDKIFTNCRSYYL